MNLLVDMGVYLSVIGFALGFTFLSVGLWNVVLQRLVADATDEKERQSFLQALKGVVLTRLKAFNERVFPRKYLQQIRRTVYMAGSPGELTAGEFVGLQQVAFTVFSFFAWFLNQTVGLRWGWVVFIALIGLFYPWIWLNDVLKKRQHAMIRALPYNLDLLTLSVEAGLDFGQALGKVIEKGRQGPLVEEFKLVLKNIKLGSTREEALKLMADRCGIPSLLSFVNALVQADRMGTSLGKVLRIQSTQLRIERTHRAEKLANEAPVKMLLPLIACIFPTVFMVLFGPIVFQMVVVGAQ